MRGLAAALLMSEGFADPPAADDLRYPSTAAYPATEPVVDADAEPPSADPAGIADAPMPVANVVPEQEELSWKIVCMMYGFGSALCALFATLEKLWGIEQVKGMWLIFAPFLPCLAYAAFKFRRQMLQEKSKRD